MPKCGPFWCVGKPRFFLRIAAEAVVVIHVLMGLSACVKGEVKLSSAGSTLNGPTFSGATVTTLLADPSTPTLSVSGNCDARMRSLEISYDNGTTWSSVSALSGADADCSDLTFSFQFSLSSAVQDLTHDSQKTVLIHGLTAFGSSDVSRIIVDFTVSSVTRVLSVASTSAAEDSGALVFIVSMTPTRSTDVTFTWGTSNGSATTADGDYTSVSPQTATVLAGSSQISLTVPVSVDTKYEADETVNVALSAPSTGASFGQSTASGTIINDDAAPLVTFLAASQSVSESVGSVTASVQLSAVSGLTVTIPFSLSGSTTSGADYSGGGSSIVIAAGSTVGTTTLSILNDSLYELTETVIFTLGTPQNASLGATSIHTVSISDNDPTPSLSIADVTVTEGTGAGTTTASFTVQLDAISGAATTVNYITSNNTATGSGIDYTSASGTLTIVAGTTTGIVNVTITRDSLYENSETFYVNLSSPAQATISDNQGLGTIVDDDVAPTVDFTASTQTVGESVGTVTISAQLSTVSAVSATIPFIVSGTATAGGTDHNAVAGQMVIAAGGLFGATTFTVTDDSLYETNETVVLTLASPSQAVLGTTTVHTVTISDNDTAPTVSIANTSVTEGTGGGSTFATFTVSLNTVSGAPAYVNYATSALTATGGGTDFTNISSATLTVAAGSLSGTLSVPVTRDSVYESAETFLVTLSSPTGSSISSAVGTATIVDDDTPPTLSIADPSVVDEGAGTVVFTVTQSAVSGLASSFTWSTSNGTALAGSDYLAVTAASVTIAAGASTSLLTVTIANDTIDEADETLTVTLAGATNSSILSGTGTATIRDALLSYDFLSGNLPSGATFTRSSTATYYDSSGVLRTSSSNSPRFNYDPATGLLKGLLMESDVWNEVLWSEDFSNAAWTRTNVTVASDVSASLAPAPDGSATADQVLDTVTNGVHKISQLVPRSYDNTDSSHPWETAFSVFAKASGTSRVIQLTLDVDTVGDGAHSAGSISAYFDLYNCGTVSSGSSTGDGSFEQAGCLPVKGGWYRLFIKGKPSIAGLGYLSASINLMSGTSTSSYAGSGKGPYLWGAQVEIENGVTSYIHTTSTRSNRVIDKIIPSCFPTCMSSSQWTVIVDAAKDFIERTSSGWGYSTFFEFRDPASHTSGHLTGRWAASGGWLRLENYLDAGTTLKSQSRINFVPSRGELFQFASQFNRTTAPNMSTMVNGLTTGTPTVTESVFPSTGALTTMWIGSSEDDEGMNANLKKLTYRQRSLSSTQMSAMTTDLTTSINFTETLRSVPESVGTVNVYVTLSQRQTSTVTIPYTVTGTATGGGTDHNLVNGSFSVSAGSVQSSAVSFTILDDGIAESTETVILTLGTPSSGALNSASVQTIEILDND